MILIYCNQTVILTNLQKTMLKILIYRVAALASLFACKIHVFYILQNEVNLIQGREFRNLNLSICSAIENQFCYALFTKRNKLQMKIIYMIYVIIDRELVYDYVGRPQLITFDSLKSLFESS